MSSIHFVGGEKGGVGKSVFSRLMMQYFIDSARPVTGLDADGSHATLSRYYGEFTRAIDIDHFESLDQIMELALESQQQLVLDLPAQSQRFLDRWMDENGVVELCAESDTALWFWYVVDDGPDSVQLLDRFLQRYAGQLECVLVKNLGRGRDFSAVDAIAGDMPRLELPALHDNTMHHLEQLALSFWAAANLREGEGHLGMMERQRAKVWQKRVFAALDALAASTAREQDSPA